MSNVLVIPKLVVSRSLYRLIITWDNPVFQVHIDDSALPQHTVTVHTVMNERYVYGSVHRIPWSEVAKPLKIVIKVDEARVEELVPVLLKVLGTPSYSKTVKVMPYNRGSYLDAWLIT